MGLLAICPVVAVEEAIAPEKPEECDNPENTQECGNTEKIPLLQMEELER